MRLSTLSSTKLYVFGAFLIFGGCLSISLGIPSATPINGSYPYGHLGYGIWGGLIYVIVGLVNAGVAWRKTPSSVIWCMVLNVVCLILGVLQLALGISAANQDFNAMWLRNLNTTDNKDLYNDYSKFYQKFFPMTYQIAISKSLVPSLHNGVVAVDALLGLTGFIVAIVAAVAASNVGRAICCHEALKDLDGITIVKAVKKDELPITVVSVTNINEAFESQA